MNMPNNPHSTPWEQTRTMHRPSQQAPPAANPSSPQPRLIQGSLKRKADDRDLEDDPFDAYWNENKKRAFIAAPGQGRVDRTMSYETRTEHSPVATISTDTVFSLSTSFQGKIQQGLVDFALYLAAIEERIHQQGEQRRDDAQLQDSFTLPSYLSTYINTSGPEGNISTCSPPLDWMALILRHLFLMTAEGDPRTVMRMEGYKGLIRIKGMIRDAVCSDKVTPVGHVSMRTFQELEATMMLTQVSNMESMLMIFLEYYGPKADMRRRHSLEVQQHRVLNGEKVVRRDTWNMASETTDRESKVLGRVLEIVKRIKQDLDFDKETCGSGSRFWFEDMMAELATEKDKELDGDAVKETSKPSPEHSLPSFLPPKGIDMQVSSKKTQRSQPGPGMGKYRNHHPPSESLSPILQSYPPSPPRPPTTSTPTRVPPVQQPKSPSAPPPQPLPPQLRVQPQRQAKPIFLSSQPPLPPPKPFLPVLSCTCPSRRKPVASSLDVDGCDTLSSSFSSFAITTILPAAPVSGECELDDTFDPQQVQQEFSRLGSVVGLLKVSERKELFQWMRLWYHWMEVFAAREKSWRGRFFMRREQQEQRDRRRERRNGVSFEGGVLSLSEGSVVPEKVGVADVGGVAVKGIRLGEPMEQSQGLESQVGEGSLSYTDHRKQEKMLHELEGREKQRFQMLRVKILGDLIRDKEGIEGEKSLRSRPLTLVQHQRPPRSFTTDLSELSTSPLPKPSSSSSLSVLKDEVGLEEELESLKMFMVYTLWYAEKGSSPKMIVGRPPLPIEKHAKIKAWAEYYDGAYAGLLRFSGAPMNASEGIDSNTGSGTLLDENVASDYSRTHINVDDDNVDDDDKDSCGRVAGQPLQDHAPDSAGPSATTTNGSSGQPGQTHARQELLQPLKRKRKLRQQEISFAWTNKWKLKRLAKQARKANKNRQEDEVVALMVSEASPSGLPLLVPAEAQWRGS